ncbi:MAG: MBL fold metallo-hydrolase [Chitinophagaceae bacterium]
MSLFITSLNSGSNGNCYYVGNHNEAILVDAGISCRETETRMDRLGLSMLKVKAIFISHEHTDHIKGLEILSKKYQLPVYITEATRRQGRLKLDMQLANIFSAKAPVTIGALAITAFAKMHDAADPYSFTVTCNGITVGVFTDIGTPCKHLVYHFKQCHAAFLEANYDDEMLDNGSYPYFLKKRITDGNGHLSNKQALELFLTHKPPFLSHLILSHLSKNNNCPVLVKDLFEQNANGVQIVVASRDQETELYQIVQSDTDNLKVVFITKAEQLTFSF